MVRRSAIPPTVTLPEAFALALQHHQAGRLADAATLYHQILAAQPNHAEALHHLGIIAHQRGQHELAVEQIRRSLALVPNNPAAFSNLGAVLAEQNRFSEAIAAYQQALQLKPDFPEAHVNLANAHRDRGQFDEAIAGYLRALTLRPNNPDALNNLGAALAGKGQYEEAIAAYQHALALKPNAAETCKNLGMAQRELGHLDEAVASYRRALAIKPDFAAAHLNLGNVLAQQGQLEAATAAYRRAAELKPDDSKYFSNLIFILPLSPMWDERILRAEQARWNRLYVDPLRPSWRPHPNTPEPNRRLKIGYVSPDFRCHPVAFFIAPLLEAHDREQCEIYCYSSVKQPDPMSALLRNSADHWRDVLTLSDAQLAQQIREDGIDILVDLAMHTADNRLAAFAHKPAPVQVSWLAYPGSAGTEAIDFRLTDAHIDPLNEEDDGFGGQPIRLPDCWCCYAPIGEFPPVSSLPAGDRQAVTFGSVNQFRKIHEGLLHCWARLLETVPESRLLIICPAGHVRERTHALFASHGIDRHRIELVEPCSWPDFLNLFARIDIALDSFPGNGMTTTCHALWMGVPTVTLAGSSAVSRAGGSLLHTLGLPEWIAQTEEDYLRIASERSSDRSGLAELRRSLRARMQSSPLMNAPRFAQNVEAACRTMWQRWCTEHPITPP